MINSFAYLGFCHPTLNNSWRKTSL